MFHRIGRSAFLAVIFSVLSACSGSPIHWMTRDDATDVTIDGREFRVVVEGTKVSVFRGETFVDNLEHREAAIVAAETVSGCELVSHHFLAASLMEGRLQCD